jgi:sigma-E factor negative regulatory protein RseA
MKAERREDTPDRPDRGEWLSTLIDGEATASAADEACRDWRGTPALRRDWHAYHLIGDVLRSEELSSTSERDAAFLGRLREQLRDEPVPLAVPAAPHAARPRRWVGAAAVAAGFAVVGVSTVVLRGANDGPTGWNAPLVVSQPDRTDTVRRVTSSAAPASARTLVIDGQVIRDTRLDAYFEAHRGAVGAGTAVPGGALRSVDLLVPQR